MNAPRLLFWCGVFSLAVWALGAWAVLTWCGVL